MVFFLLITNFHIILSVFCCAMCSSHICMPGQALSSPASRKSTPCNISANLIAAFSQTFKFFVVFFSCRYSNAIFQHFFLTSSYFFLFLFKIFLISCYFSFTTLSFMLCCIFLLSFYLSLLHAAFFKGSLNHALV